MHDPLNVYRGRYKEFIEDSINNHPEYFERQENTSRHHVIPECCEGTNDNETNLLIFLPYRLHFLAHKILYEENPNHKGLLYAYWRMCNGRFNECTSEEYEEARIKFSNYMSKSRKGKPSPMKGKTLTEEHRKSLSIALSGERNPMYGKGYLLSGENHPMYGKKGKESPNYSQIRTEEQRLNISLSKKGKSINFSESHRENLKKS